MDLLGPCGSCSGCRGSPCGICAYCRDNPKYGGPGFYGLQRCIYQQCLLLLESSLQQEVLSGQRGLNLGCDACKACLGADCGICATCVDKQFFGGIYFPGSLCRVKRCCAQSPNATCKTISSPVSRKNGYTPVAKSTPKIVQRNSSTSSRAGKSGKPLKAAVKIPSPKGRPPKKPLAKKSKKQLPSEQPVRASSSSSFDDIFSSSESEQEVMPRKKVPPSAKGGGMSISGSSFLLHQQPCTSNQADLCQKQRDRVVQRLQSMLAASPKTGEPTSLQRAIAKFGTEQRKFSDFRPYTNEEPGDKWERLLGTEPTAPKPKTESFVKSVPKSVATFNPGISAMLAAENWSERPSSGSTGGPISCVPSRVDLTDRLDFEVSLGEGSPKIWPPAVASPQDEDLQAFRMPQNILPPISPKVAFERSPDGSGGVSNPNWDESCFRTPESSPSKSGVDETTPPLCTSEDLLLQKQLEEFYSQENHNDWFCSS